MEDLVAFEIRRKRRRKIIREKRAIFLKK